MVGPTGFESEGNELVLEPGQDLVLRDSNGTERLRLDAATGTVRIRASNGDIIALLDAPGANLRIGGSQRDGDLLLYAARATSQEDSQAAIVLDSNLATIRVGSEATGQPGNLFIRDSDGENIIILNGLSGNATLGHRSKGGTLFIKDNAGENTIVLNGVTGNLGLGANGNGGELFLKDGTGRNTIVCNGTTGNVVLGTNGKGGQLFLKDVSGENTIILNGIEGNAALGAVGNGGQLFIKDDSGRNTIVLNGNTGNAALGTFGNGGQLFIKDNLGEDTIVLNGITGNIGLGKNGQEGNLFVKNNAGSNTIHLSGQTGDILLNNADCAEEFEISGIEALDPGTVMVIDDNGTLRSSDMEYDKRVAGVLAGAGDYKPGIILDKKTSSKNRMPLSLIGKAYCKVDAQYASIEVGDLLTTSLTPGYAMKASDPYKAFGAVIGKALQPCRSGQGLIPILIALQ